MTGSSALKSHPLAKTFSECLQEELSRLAQSDRSIGNCLGSFNLKPLNDDTARCDQADISEQREETCAAESLRIDVVETMRRRDELLESLRARIATRHVEHDEMERNLRIVEEELQSYFQGVERLLSDIKGKALHELDSFRATNKQASDDTKKVFQDILAESKGHVDITHAAEVDNMSLERLENMKISLNGQVFRLSDAVGRHPPERMSFNPGGGLSKYLETLKAEKVLAMDASPVRNHKPFIILAGRSRGLQVLCSETLVAEHPHDDNTNAVAACSIHENLAISASTDGAALVYNVCSGKELLRFAGHADSLTCSAIMSSGSTAVTGSMDCTLKVWDISTGAVRQDLRGHIDWIYSCAVTPDDLMLVSASADRSLRVWDLSTGRSVRKLNGHNGSVLCCAIVDDGSLVLSGSRDKTAKVWDVMTGRLLFTLSGHEDWVLSCAILSNATGATGSADGTIMIWDLTTGELQRLIKGLNGWVHALLPMSNNSELASVSEDKRLCVWDVATGNLKRSIALSSVYKSAAISKAEMRKGVEVPKSVITTAAWDLHSMRSIPAPKALDAQGLRLSLSTSRAHSPRASIFLDSPQTPPATPQRRMSVFGLSSRMFLDSPQTTPSTPQRRMSFFGLSSRFSSSSSLSSKQSSFAEESQAMDMKHKSPRSAFMALISSKISRRVSRRHSDGGDGWRRTPSQPLQQMSVDALENADPRTQSSH